MGDELSVGNFFFFAIKIPSRGMDAPSVSAFKS